MSSNHGTDSTNDPPWVRGEDLPLGAVRRSRLGDVVLVAKEGEGPDLKLVWRAGSGETLTTVMTAEERGSYVPLARSGEG
jgi:hypothetical protein